jgi:hypothetical protein
VTFQLPENAPADIHGLCLFFDGSTNHLAAMPLTPHEDDVAIEIEMLKKSAAMFSDPISKVGAEAIALSVQHGQRVRAAMFAQALHELTGDRFILIQRPIGGTACDSTYEHLPIDCMADAQALLGNIVTSGAVLALPPV